jgi:selenocysteine-specific elongation factor
VAVNLTGVSVAEVARGDVLANGGRAMTPTYLLDTELQFTAADDEPEHGVRVQIHHGTRESPARLAWLSGRFWQVRLEHPVVAERGDRLVVRQIAPPDTLGGGAVLDAHPKKHGPSRELLVRLTALSRGEDPVEVVDAPQPATTRPPEPAPLTAETLLVEQRLRDAGLEPPPDAELDADALRALRDAGRAVRVSKTLHYHPDALAEARRRITELAATQGGAVTLAQVRDGLGTSRKFAQALLEHLDSERVTIRRGDAHVLRRRTA